MADYRVLACDWNGGILGQLNVTNLTFSSILNDAGSISFDVPVPQYDTPGTSTPTLVDIVSWTRPSLITLYVDRRDDQGNSVLVWGGFLWTRAWSQADVAFKITGQEFLSWAASRVIPSVSPTNGLYTGTWGYGQLLKQLMTDAQNVSESGYTGSINMTLPSGFTTPTDNDVATFTADYQYVNLEQLSQAVTDLTGTEYLEAWTTGEYVSGVPTPTLNFGVPLAGSPVSSTGLAIDLQTCPSPGYTYDEDGTKQGNKIIGSGSLDSGGTSLQIGASAFTGAFGATSYPLLEQVENPNQVNSQGMLNAIVAADASLLGLPVITMTVPFFSDGDPTAAGRQLFLTDIGLGYQIQVQTEAFTDPRFPFGTQQLLRIVSYETTVPDQGGNPVTVMTLNATPTYSGW